MFFMFYILGLDVLLVRISYCTFLKYTYPSFFSILGILLFYFLYSYIFFLIMLFLLYDSDSMSLRRHHFLLVVSIALATSKVMFN